MKTHSGRHPRTTAEQIAAILEWHSNRRTLDDWSRIFGVARATVQNSIAAYVSPEQWHFAHKRVDGTGKRRYLRRQRHVCSYRPRECQCLKPPGRGHTVAPPRLNRLMQRA